MGCLRGVAYAGESTAALSPTGRCKDPRAASARLLVDFGERAADKPASLDGSGGALIEWSDSLRELVDRAKQLPQQIPAEYLKRFAVRVGGRSGYGRGSSGESREREAAIGPEEAIR